MVKIIETSKFIRYWNYKYSSKYSLIFVIFTKLYDTQLNPCMNQVSHRPYFIRNSWWMKRSVIYLAAINSWMTSALITRLVLAFMRLSFITSTWIGHFWLIWEVVSTELILVLRYRLCLIWMLLMLSALPSVTTFTRIGKTIVVKTGVRCSVNVP